MKKLKAKKLRVKGIGSPQPGELTPPVTSPNDVYPNAFNDKDIQIHAPDVSEPGGDAQRQPGSESTVKPEADKPLEKKEGELSSPLKYVIDAPGAIDKIEGLTEKIAEARPDLAPQISKVAQAVEELEHRALGDIAYQQHEGMPPAEQFEVNDRVMVALEEGDYTGFVEAIEPNGSLKIHTEQGMTLNNVPPTSVQKQGSPAMPMASLKTKAAPVKTEKKEATKGGQLTFSFPTADLLKWFGLPAIDLDEPVDVEVSDKEVQDVAERYDIDITSEENKDKVRTAIRYASEGAYQSHYSKEIMEALESALETFSDYHYDYFIAGEQGEEDVNGTAVGIEPQSIQVNYDATTFRANKDIVHIINDVLSGYGMFYPDLTEDSDIKDIQAQFHNLSDYYEVYGERKPEVSGGEPSFMGFDKDLKMYLAEEGFPVKANKVDGWKPQPKKAAVKKEPVTPVKTDMKAGGKKLKAAAKDLEAKSAEELQRLVADWKRRVELSDDPKTKDIITAKIAEAESIITKKGGTAQPAIEKKLEEPMEKPIAEIKHLPEIPVGDEQLSASQKVEASVFDQIPEIDLGSGYKARRKAVKKERTEKEEKLIEVVDNNDKVVETYPDAFGDDAVPIIKLLRQILDIKEGTPGGEKEKVEKKESKPKGKEESASDKPLAMPEVKKSSKDEDKLKASAQAMEVRIGECREIATRLMRLGHIQASQDYIDRLQVQGKSLTEAQRAAAIKAVDEKVMELLAQKDEDLLLLKASLPLMKQKVTASQSKDGSLPLLNLSASAVILSQAESDGPSVGDLFSTGFRRR